MSKSLNNLCWFINVSFISIPENIFKNYLLGGACIAVGFAVNCLSSFAGFPDCLIFVDWRRHMMVGLRLCRLRSGNSLN